MLVSGEQQNDSGIHLYILFQMLFPDRLLQDSVVPCAIQQNLADYLFKILFNSVSCKIMHIQPFPIYRK